MTEKKMTVDVWSDVACPWCFLGERSFDDALAGFEHSDAVVVRYHSYQLNPEAPERFPGTEREYLAQVKGLPADRIDEMHQMIAARGDELGIAYDFDAVQVANTRLAHELLQFAESVGQQPSMLEALFSAYFEQGTHVGGLDELVELAATAGLDAEAARQALESHAFAEAVNADIAQAAAYGINGVPFFVFDQQYGVSGAQSPETFGQVLQTVWDGPDSADEGENAS